MVEPIAIEQAVILAGGRGTRLKPIADRLPKPLAPVNGVPFLSYVFDMLAAAGIRRVVLLVGYKAELIIDRYGNRLPNGLEVGYSVGSVEDETGRRVLNALPMLDEHFLLMYGDSYWPLPLAGMTAAYQRHGTPIQSTVFSNRHGTGEYGYENNVTVGPDGIVTCYDKSRQNEGLNGLDIGFFLIRRTVLDPAAGGNPSFEESILTRCISRREVAAWVTDTQYHYITNVDSLDAFGAVARTAGLRHI